MNIKDLKVGNFAVNKSEIDCNTTIGKKYPIIYLNERVFYVVNDKGDLRDRKLDDTDWTFEPNPFRLNTQSTIVEVTTKVLVTFEKTQIENGEQYLIKTIELADMPDLRKEVEYQVHNLENQALDVINVKWEK